MYEEDDDDDHGDMITMMMRICDIIIPRGSYRILMIGEGR